MSEWKKGKPVLSTGQPSTLGVYRQHAVDLFGEDSKAIKYLDKEIAEQGEDETVLTNESQMIQVLTSIHKKKEER